MSIRPLPSQGYLKSRFDYDPETGVLTWRDREGDDPKVKSWNTRYAGKPAGTRWKKNAGRQSSLVVSINKQLCQAHRVIWMMATGEQPIEVDHINGDATDNRWGNLRNISHARNMRNLKKKKNNTSGVTGVLVDKKTGKYIARIQFNNKQIRIGTFTCIKAAEEALIAKRVELGFTEHHGQER